MRIHIDDSNMIEAFPLFDFDVEQIDGKEALKVGRGSVPIIEISREACFRPILREEDNEDLRSHFKSVQFAHFHGALMESLTRDFAFYVKQGVQVFMRQGMTLIENENVYRMQMRFALLSEEQRLLLLEKRSLEAPMSRRSS